MLAPVAISLTALLSAVAGRSPLDPVIVLVQTTLTIALYPPLAWLFGRAQRLFLAGI
jgi:hypothetical protein